MSTPRLTKPPLVEAIFEFHWTLQTSDQGISIDPHGKLLLGSLYTALRHRYPVHEQLPSALVPDELVPHQVQHRLRHVKDGWPLVQLGPGVLTVNDTEQYNWERFRELIAEALSAFHDARPEPDADRVESVHLRYINAAPLDGWQTGILGFLGEKLKLDIRLDPSLFANTGVSAQATDADLRFTFATISPSGQLSIRFARGNARGKESLIWEMGVSSAEARNASEIDRITEWIGDAHALAERWFFRLIDGQLLEEFTQ